MQARVQISIFDKPRLLWPQCREASLNWLALGLLLAAWNAADGDADPGLRHRPRALRDYTTVSVRAIQRAQCAAPPVRAAANSGVAANLGAAVAKGHKSVNEM